MKKILSLLLIFVFLQVESWAISGGPDFGSGNLAVTGTYAGVLLPEIGEDTTGTAGGAAGAGANSVELDANAIGIFSLGVPDSGFATGGAAFFNKGEVFTGKISGVVDPEDGHVTALMEASAIRIITVEVDAGSAVGAFGSDVRTVGRLEADITEGDSIFSNQRIEGSAILNSFSDANRNTDGTPIISGTVRFAVDGFKQSVVVTSSNAPDFNINASSAQ